MKTPAPDKSKDSKKPADKDRDYYQGTRYGSAQGGGRIRIRDDEDEEFSRRGLGQRDYPHRDKE